MKVALVHDWLTGMRGGERCLLAFLRLYPRADIFTLLHLPGRTSAGIDERVRGTSFLQRLPGIAKYYRLCLPLFPLAVRGFDFTGYDLVISLSHSAVKNIRVPAGCVHVSYCFTPMRYIRDQAWQYFGLATPFLWPVLALLRRWDRRGAQGPDAFVAISRFIAARIRHFYGRDSEVIYPPVDTSWIARAGSGSRGRAFLYAGALVPYKRPELIVRAFNELAEPLWVVGSGPLLSRLKRIAGPNIHFFGQVSDAELSRFSAECRALIFPVREDFGMVPIECLAAGRPVIGLYEGALRETLRG
ncbi:MAG: glycosyltransferase, partial [Prosthecobacter sp.]|nr:glycosyltransferase [Prosthecobacter sp.]